MRQKLWGYLQQILPHKIVSIFAGQLAEAKSPWIKRFLIKRFIHAYQVDLSNALEENPDMYKTFNDFFTRQIKPQARPIDTNPNTIISPVDGCIAEMGSMNQNRLLQAKNFYFTLESLLGDESIAKHFVNGSFATLYLAPHNYHRVHMPLDGKLIQTNYIPGKLFSVNRLTADIIPQLYSRNERLVCLFDTVIGPMALVFVGAMIVGNICTTWEGSVPRSNKTQETHFNQSIFFKKGDELGHFKLGSTIILLFPFNSIIWQNNQTLDRELEFGQVLGKLKANT